MGTTFNLFYDVALFSLGDSERVGVHHVLDAVDAALAKVRANVMPRVADDSPLALRRAAVELLVAEGDANEHLFGAAFVVGQALITAGISYVKGLHELAEADGRALSLPKEARAIRAYGDSRSIPLVEIVWAAANFYKHHSEWPADWSSATGHAAQTITVLAAVGVKQNAGIDDNLRLVLRVLGDGSEMGARFALADNAINPWRRRLADAATAELLREGLIAPR